MDSVYLCYEIRIRDWIRPRVCVCVCVCPVSGWCVCVCLCVCVCVCVPSVRVVWCAEEAWTQIWYGYIRRKRSDSDLVCDLKKAK